MKKGTNPCRFLGLLMITGLSLTSSLVFGATCKEDFRGKISWDETGQIALLPGGARADLVENGIMMADNEMVNGESEAVFSFPKGILSPVSPAFTMHVRLSYSDGTYTYERNNCVVKGEWFCEAKVLDATVNITDDEATALLCTIPNQNPSVDDPLPISFTAVSRDKKSWSFIITTPGIVSSGSAYKL